jgi:hypothetical protein
MPSSNCVLSATYFVTLVDFTDVGDMAVFIDEEQLEDLEARMRERGYLEAHDLAMSFNMLRANDLIWSFVVNNYLLGKEPMPFDLLYWNAVKEHRNFIKHRFFWRQVSAIFGHGLLTSEGEFWQRQRRLAAPAFSGQRLAKYGAVMVATPNACSMAGGPARSRTFTPT